MADTSIQITRPQAVELYNVINVMTGGASYKLLRVGIQDKIAKLWPEIKESSVQTPKDESRKLALTSREQKAIAEGLLGLITKKNQFGEETLTGHEFSFLTSIARTCKISKWLTSKIEEQEVPEFEEELDDEVPIGDEQSPV